MRLSLGTTGLSLVLLFVAAPLAADPVSDPSIARGEAPGIAASIHDLAWLEGRWEGTGIDGQPAGERYSRIADGRLVGHFWQLDGNGAVMFYELITIMSDGDSVVMRLKHFDSGLAGWEDASADAAMAFPLLSRAADSWVFGPVTYTRNGEDELVGSVVVSDKGGITEKVEFRYRRVSDR